MKVFKTIWLLCLLALIAEYAKGQVIMTLIFGDKLNSDEMAFGLHLDYSWNHLSGIDPSAALKTVDLGLFITYKLNEKWRLNAEIMAKYKRGAAGMKPYALGNPVLDAGYANGQFSRSAGYLSLPVSFQYVLFSQFYAEAGPYVSIRINAKDKFITSLPEGESSLTRDVKELTNAWDVGALGGIGMLIGKAKLVAAGLRYTIGFSDVAKDLSGRQANRSLYLYANIPMGRAKAARKAAEKKANENQ